MRAASHGPLLPGACEDVTQPEIADAADASQAAVEGDLLDGSNVAQPPTIRRRDRGRDTDDLDKESCIQGRKAIFNSLCWVCPARGAGWQ